MNPADLTPKIETKMKNEIHDLAQELRRLRGVSLSGALTPDDVKKLS